MLDNTHHPLPASPEFDRRKSLRGGGGVSRSETEGVYKNATSHNDNQSLHLTRSLLRLSLLLIAAFTGVVVLIHARPYDDSELRAFLLPPEGCPAPCWQGISPGVTTAEEAVTILRSHPWVDYVEYLGSHIVWKWSSKAPHVIGSPVVWNSLELSPDNHIVEGVELSTDFPWGNLWLIYGQPTYTVPQIASEPAIEWATRQFAVWYSEHYLATYVQIPCVLNYEPFWKAQTALVIISDAPLQYNLDTRYMPGFPHWNVFEFLDLNRCN